MPHTAGTSGPTSGTSVDPGDSYISSAIDIKGVTLKVASVLGDDMLGFLRLFIPTLLTQKYKGDKAPVEQFNPTLTNTSRVPEIQLEDNISFSQLTDSVYPYKAPFKGQTYLHLENNSKRVLLRRDKLKRNAPLLQLENITRNGSIPFEIQIRSNTRPKAEFPDTRQVDYMLYYLAKVGYAASIDSDRIKRAFQEVYIYFFATTSAANPAPIGDPLDVSDANIAGLQINFTPPVQIGVNDKNCGGYEIPGSDKRTAIAVLHDKVQCIAALIHDLSSNPVVTGPILPQYVAYDHGLVGDLGLQTDVESLPKEPVDWLAWYKTPGNNPTTNETNKSAGDLPPWGEPNDMTGPDGTSKNLREWVMQGKVLVFKSPLGAGTLSIYLSEFPFTEQESILPVGSDYADAKDGVFIRLCNGNNPYNAAVNPHNGNSAYDDRFIFFDKYYRVLANITPGESVRVTWCSTQPTPGWISIVGT